MTLVAGDMRIIFICYRREDSGDHAHRLRDALSTSFGERQVFVDLEIPPGADVRRYIAEKLSSCAVLLVVIGPDWLTSSDENGARRLTRELDFVRLEIATALQNDDTVVMPLLVKSARMPNKSELPQEIERLADLNAHALADGVHWQYDVTRLTAAIKETLPLEDATRGQAGGGRSKPYEALWATAHTRRRYAVAAAAALAVLAAVLIVSLSGDPTLRIFSSLPQRQQLQPLDAESRPYNAFDASDSTRRVPGSRPAGQRASSSRGRGHRRVPRRPDVGRDAGVDSAPQPRQNPAAVDVEHADRAREARPARRRGQTRPPLPAAARLSRGVSQLRADHPARHHPGQGAAGAHDTTGRVGHGRDDQR